MRWRLNRPGERGGPGFGPEPEGRPGSWRKTSPGFPFLESFMSIDEREIGVLFFYKRRNMGMRVKKRGVMYIKERPLFENG